MMAKMFVIETTANGDMFSSTALLSGHAKEISKAIAEIHADEQIFVNTGDLLQYTILISMYNYETKEWEVV